MKSVLTLFFFNPPPAPEIYTLSLHDALPISLLLIPLDDAVVFPNMTVTLTVDVGDAERVLLVPVHEGERSEEHTSELQSPDQPVCRLLLEKKPAEVACVVVEPIPGDG